MSDIAPKEAHELWKELAYSGPINIEYGHSSSLFGATIENVDDSLNGIYITQSTGTKAFIPFSAIVRIWKMLPSKEKTK